MEELKELRAKLQALIETRGALAKLAELAKIDQATVGRIAAGKIKNPSWQSVAAIKSAIAEYEDEAPAAAAAGQ